MGGKANFKWKIAQRTDFDASLLPYNSSLLEYLKHEHHSGRTLVLATASNEKYARAIADYLGIFDDIIASDATTNLSGRTKGEQLQKKWGDPGFVYAGNDSKDLAVWDFSDSAILVNPGKRLRSVAEKRFHIRKIFEDQYRGGLLQFVKAMRLHQWLKNVLVFVPLLAAHQVQEYALLGKAVLAFLSFGLCASSVYLLNDFIDLPADRIHPTKRNRPFAAGSVSVMVGAMMIPALLGSAFFVAFMVGREFTGVLALYFLITLAYSLRLKRAALIDVLVLAGLYTVRIFAGGAAVSIQPSFWLLTFSMFLFLSLALVKRYTELLTLKDNGKEYVAGRGYRASDIETLAQFGTASAYMAVLVLVFYINSDAVKALYSHPERIWLLCPLLLYLVSRIWLLARRGELHEDPVVFIMRDRRSQWVMVAAIALLVFSMY